MNDALSIVFGGGCFWCTEAVFRTMRGILEVTPGYAGGTVSHPTYEAVCSGDTGHAEVIRITYEPDVITLETLLTIFFASHDPTTINRQGNDVGTQYRSIILYTTEEQQRIATHFIDTLNASSDMGAPIVTEVVPLEVFYPAEAYHHNYYENNKGQAYCQVVINPKLAKIQQQFATLLKNEKHG